MPERSRRNFLKSGASIAAASAVGATAAGQSVATASSATRNSASGGDATPVPSLQWPDEVQEGPDTPKLCQWFSRDPDESTVRRWRQAGVTGALITGPPPLPWDIRTLRADRQRIESHGMHITGYLIEISADIVHATARRDRAIRDVKMSIMAAGAAGIPVIEYNFYVHRLSEGYYEIIDTDNRLGAGYTGFDYNREIDGVPVKDLPRLPETPPISREQLWENYTHFLQEVVPVAERAGVRLAVHPNDPPAPVSRGNPQILASVDDWKRMVETVDSPSNGMTVHSGVTTEVGFDAIKFLRYMGRKDRVNHVHFRNVRVDEPNVKYAEVFPDTGETDMFGFMRELIRQGYNRGILAEHPRALDYDRDNDAIGGQYADVGGGGHGGELYDTGYARAMMQAALTLER